MEEENNISLDINQEIEEINLKLEEIKSRGANATEEIEEEEKPVEKNIKVVKIDLDKKRL